MTNTRLTKKTKIITLFLSQMLAIVKKVKLRRSKLLSCSQKNMAHWTMDISALRNSPGKGTISRGLNDPNLQTEESKKGSANSDVGSQKMRI